MYEYDECSISAKHHEDRGDPPEPIDWNRVALDAFQDYISKEKQSEYKYTLIQDYLDGKTTIHLPDNAPEHAWSWLEEHCEEWLADYRAGEFADHCMGKL